MKFRTLALTLIIFASAAWAQTASPSANDKVAGVGMIAFRDLQPCYRFASSIALFGGLLKKSRFMHQADWKDAILMAEQSSSPDDTMQQEFITLIEKARKIYGRRRKREEY